MGSAVRKRIKSEASASLWIERFSEICETQATSTLPLSPEAAKPHALELMTRKDKVQAEIDAQLRILSANSVNLRTPLVDREGFPRADIDIVSVRNARVRIIELRNDMNAIMTEIGWALETVYQRGLVSEAEQAGPPASQVHQGAFTERRPFAKVDGVAPGSPAAQAGLQRGDLIVEFGSLSSASFTSSSLKPLADLVVEYENRPLEVGILRSSQGDQAMTLTFTPRRGWGGNGLLGCHIVPAL